MAINRKAFYENYKEVFNKSKINQAQVNGYESMIDWWEENKNGQMDALAYCLATAYHETGGRMEPVREGFCSTNQGSIDVVTRLYERGVIKKNYAIPEPNGNSYYGRGLVQITWPHNYIKLGEALGIGMALYDNPDLALELDVAVKILFIGMYRGLFTGRSLEAYINPQGRDYVGARRVVNGLDRAELVASYALNFLTCLTNDRIEA